MEDPIDTVMKMAFGGIFTLLLRGWWDRLREKRDRRVAFVDFLTKWKNEVAGYPRDPTNCMLIYMESIPKLNGEAEVFLNDVPKRRRHTFKALVATAGGFAAQHIENPSDTPVKKAKITAAIDELISFAHRSPIGLW